MEGEKAIQVEVCTATRKNRAIKAFAVEISQGRVKLLDGSRLCPKHLLAPFFSETELVYWRNDWIEKGCLVERGEWAELMNDVEVESFGTASKITCGNNGDHTWRSGLYIRPTYRQRFEEEQAIFDLSNLALSTVFPLSKTKWKIERAHRIFDKHTMIPYSAFNQSIEHDNPATKQSQILGTQIYSATSVTISTPSQQDFIPLEPKEQKNLKAADEILRAFESTGWRGEAGYEMRNIFPLMLWQGYFLHDDARRFLSTYSGISLTITALPSRNRTYHLKLSWQTTFPQSQHIVHFMKVLKYKLVLCPVGTVNGKVLLLSESIRPGKKPFKPPDWEEFEPREQGKKEGPDPPDPKIKATFFVAEAFDGKRIGCVGNNILAVIEWFSGEDTAGKRVIPRELMTWIFNKNTTNSV